MTIDKIDNTDFGGIADLDALFSQAHEQQPELTDENFTKVVINSLPTQVSRVGLLRGQARGLSFDLFGLILGVVAVMLFIKPAQLVGSVLNYVPESVVVSPSSVSFVVLALMGLSYGAWWAVEKLS